MFENIPACDSWQCYNSFALWISSIGTVVISSLALWLSVKDRFLRMDASFKIGTIGGKDPNRLDTLVYILSFTNVGARPITVTNYEWRIPLSKKGIGKHITNPYNGSFGHRCTKFPVQLTDGQSGYLFHDKNFFSAMENRETFLYAERKIIAWFKIRFFKVYIATSVGKGIRSKVDPALRKALWKEYNTLAKKTALDRL
jgi:hypothetical protein